MLEIQLEDYKYFLWEYKNNKSLNGFAQEFYKTFEIGDNIFPYILEMDENNARQEIFNKFLVN